MIRNRVFVKVHMNDEEYYLKYDFNSVADIEEYFRKGIGQILSEEMMGFNTIRVFYWVGLRWKIKNLTLQKTGKILGEYLAEGGDFEYLVEKMQEALEKAKIIKSQEEDEDELEDFDEDEELDDPNE